MGTGIGLQIVNTFTDALSGFASGIASTLRSTFEAVALNSEGGISNLAIWGLTFGAATLAIGLVRVFSRKIG